MMLLFVMRCRICLCSLLLVCLHCSVVSNTYMHVSNTYRFVPTQMSVRVNLKIYILKCINKYCYKTFGIVVTKHLVLLLQNIGYCCFKTCCIVGTQHLVLLFQNMLYCRYTTFGTECKRVHCIIFILWR